MMFWMTCLVVLSDWMTLLSVVLTTLFPVVEDTTTEVKGFYSYSSGTTSSPFTQMLTITGSSPVYSTTSTTVVSPSSLTRVTSCLVLNEVSEVLIDWTLLSVYIYLIA